MAFAGGWQYLNMTGRELKKKKKKEAAFLNPKKGNVGLSFFALCKIIVSLDQISIDLDD